MKANSLIEKKGVPKMIEIHWDPFNEEIRVKKKRGFFNERIQENTCCHPTGRYE